MAKIEKLIAIYTGPALNAPASNVLRLPSITGTITGVYFDASEVTDGDLELELFEDGVSVTPITVADTTANEDVTGLSFSSTLGKVLSLSLISPLPAGVPAPPWSLIVTVEVTETHVALTGNQTIAGTKTFSTAPLIPANAYDATSWNGSLKPATEDAVRDKIESLGTGSVATDPIFDAKGDLPVGTGANTAARLPVGTNGQILSADSAETTGLKWISAPGGGDLLAANNLSDVANAATARTNLGVGTGDSPQFTAVNIGAATDTTVTRVSAGVIAVEGATIYAQGGALGTPASGTLTNCSGLPVSGITASTATALGVGSVELGHASDTTISRVSAGVAAIEGNNIVTANNLGTGVLTQLGLAANGSDSDAIGFRGIPQNAQSGNYTLVLADAGKHIFHASGDGSGDTYTIPANASVAFEVGTSVTFVNLDSNSVSIAITTDTMYLGGTGTTGTRTLTQYGVATAIKVTSTAWIISGSGLT